MQQSSIDQLQKLLSKLKNYAGYFIIQTQQTDSAKTQDSAIFCQLLKLDTQNPIRFEAVSHYFNSTIDKNLESSFKSLGFALENGENYTKFIKLDSEDAIDGTVKEIVKIFEGVYGVGVDNAYRFEEEMEG